MQRGATILLMSIAWAGVAVPGWAQTVETTGGEPSVAVNESLMPPAPDADEWEKRVIELKKWMAAYEDWRTWNEQWRNRPEPGWVGFRERRHPPDPPAWLIADCDVLIAADGILGEACVMLAEQKTDFVTAARQKQIAAARTQKEAPSNTSWWEHVHLDLFWPMAQWRGSVYGVIGVHATVEVVKRFQVFVAPGAILINLPSGTNSREWQPAADWGIAYRLTDFRFPGTGQWSTLHFNFAKAWILSGGQGFMRSSINLAGFSITFKKDPK